MTYSEAKQIIDYPQAYTIEEIEEAGRYIFNRVIIPLCLAGCAVLAAAIYAVARWLL